jgi:hypothetical protein
MGEDEWLRAAGWQRATNGVTLLQRVRAQASDRKLRLFACACCRTLWNALDEAGRHAVETAERYADGRADAEQLRLAWARTGAFTCESLVCCPRSPYPLQLLIEDCNNFRVSEAAALVREVFGNPFRRPRIEPRWLVANGGVVAQLAQVIYEERRFVEMPVLGDALEDAGCMVRDLLEHCRSGAGHALGCWVVDALLGKS